MNLTLFFHGNATRNESPVRRLKPLASGALVLVLVLSAAAIAVSGFAINLGKLNTALNNGSLASSEARFAEPLVEIGAVPAETASNTQP